jgi:hypothetical protein
MGTGFSLVGVAIALLVSASAAAQEFKPYTGPFGRKPVHKLPSIDWSWRPPADQNQTAKASVVCGMTLIPGDPKIDPKIRANVPDRGVVFTMRAVQPTVCKAP